MTQLRGAAVLLTGATGGLGRATATALAVEGCRLVLTGRNESLLESLASTTGGKPIVADLSKRSELERLLEVAGPVDVAVLNAALPGSGELRTWDQGQIDTVLEINLAGPIAMTRALLPGFLERRSGHFVFISSLAAMVGPPAIVATNDETSDGSGALASLGV